MIVRIDKPPAGGTIRAIPSKSYAHRLLICAALADGETFIECAGSSDDIKATADCLTALGAGILRTGNGFAVKPAAITDGEKTLRCGESGSTYRFLLPVSCALGVSSAFVLEGRLPSRPTGLLLGEITKHGCTVTGAGEAVVRVSGKLESGEYTLHGGVSSQFISGLLLALPMLAGDSVIRIEGTEESKPYIDMTLEVLRGFGIEVERGDGRYKIPGGQTYRSPGRVKTEGDWSNAAFWLTAGMLCGGITCTGLNPDSAQGDRAIVRFLQNFGAGVSFDGDTVTVTREENRRGVKIDAGDTPDLVPVLAAAASVSKGETVFYNAARLRIKESDRLATVRETLGILGADIEEISDGLLLRGRSTLVGGTINSYGDHRIAMTAAVASCVCKEPVIIEGAEAVKKSYPGFFDDFCSLGGKITVLEG